MDDMQKKKGNRYGFTLELCETLKMNSLIWETI
jgi:hypothetical protein